MCIRDRRNGVGVANGNGNHFSGLGFGVLHQAGGGKVPSVGADRRVGSGAAAQGKDAGHVRQFAEGNAVDEILTAAIDGVVYFERVVAIGGDLVVENRVLVETEMVGGGEFLAGCVAEGDGGLEPAGDGVGDVGLSLIHI